VKEHFISAKQLKLILARDEGCRVGETAVVSNKVHTLDPAEPAVIRILRGADAGKTFYKRKQGNEVVHVDIFHSIAAISPITLAKAARTAVLLYRDALAEHMGPAMRAPSPLGTTSLADYIDLQCGQGGGRITGRLTFGQGQRAKENHRNHVHFTLLLSEKDFAFIFFLVEQVERTLESLGCGLRKVERIIHEEGSNRVIYDESAYSSYSDTFLREERELERSLREGNYRNYLRDIADLLEESEDPEELRELIMLASPACNLSVAGRGRISPETAKKLVGYNYWQQDNGRYTLTEQGTFLADFLKRCGRQIECDLKPKFKPGRGRGQERLVETRSAVRAKALSPVSTLIASFKRSVTGDSWQVEPKDLLYVSRESRGKCDILLLVDASASMLGPRLKAAKVLASHLLNVTKDRVGVIYFQESKATVAVHFTRNRTLLRAGLRNIIPEGLTPLSLGMEKAASYLCRYASVNESLLVVITDGVPTLSKSGSDPLLEAVETAESLQKHGIKLCFIGLLPNKEMLSRLSKTANGNLYVIEEITPEKLVGIVTTEWQAVMRASRRDSPLC